METILPMLIVGLTQMIKNSGLVSDKYLPFVAVGFGAMFGAVFGINEDIISWIIAGVLYGLATTGIISLAKGEINKLTKKQ